MFGYDLKTAGLKSKDDPKSYGSSGTANKTAQGTVKRENEDLVEGLARKSKGVVPVYPELELIGTGKLAKETAKAILEKQAVKKAEQEAIKKQTVESNSCVEDYQQYDQFREENAVHWKTKEPLSGGNWAWGKEAPNGGAVLGSEKIRPTAVGENVDRFGAETGSYMAPSKVPLDQRSLPPGTLRPNSLHNYVVLKEFKVRDEIISPAFGQPGGGSQIRAIIPEVPNGYATVEQLKKFGYLGDK